MQRAKRSDQRWLKQQSERQIRFARFREAIRKGFSFIPMVQKGLSVLWATMANFFAGPTRPIRGATRSGMVRWGKGKRRGRKATRSRTGHKSDMSSKTYEVMEPRQLLAIDFLTVGLNNDTGTVAMQTSDPTVLVTFPTSGSLQPSAGDTVFIGDSSSALVGSASLTPSNITSGSAIVPVTGLTDGMITLTATSNSAGGTFNTANDSFTFTLDTAAPTAPAVNPLLTNDVSPIITGTFDNTDSGGGLSVTVDGTTYTLADTKLTTTGSAWSLDLSDTGTTPAQSLTEANFDVSVTATDGAGNMSVDITIGEVDIDLTSPATAPTVVSQITNNVSPVITGTFDDTDAAGGLSVTIDGTTYTGTDPHLTVSGSDWTLDLSVAPAQILAEGVFNVEVSATDGAGNSTVDTTIGELEIDLTAPVATTKTFDFTLIEEGDTGVATAAVLTVDFNEAMNTGVIPTVTTNALSTLGAPVSITWTDADTLSVVFADLADADVELADVLVSITGAEDLAGNVMAMNGVAMSTGAAIDTLLEEVSFTVNDPDPQEDNLADSDPSNDGSLVQAQVTFTIDEATAGDTTVSFRIDSGSATAGVDFVVPDPDGPLSPGTSTLTGTGPTAAYVGTIIIPAGRTSVQLDIDITPDLILEGNEDLTVSITGASIAGPSEAGQPTESVAFINRASPLDTIIIEDNETGSVVSLEAVDMHAAEGPLLFPAVDTAGDSVLTDGGGTTRTTAAGVAEDVFTIDVFNNQYDEIIVSGIAGTTDSGSAAVSVRLFYTDGTIIDTLPSQTFPDGVPFDAIFAADPTRTLDRVEISVNTTDGANGGDGGDFIFNGASGVFKGGDTGLFRLNLDTELTSDLDVVIDTTTGEAVAGDSGAGMTDGVDYFLQVESVPGSGNFDTELGVTSGLVTVTIPAGTTSVDIKLTTLEDMVIEGGLVDSPGIEEAILVIEDDGLVGSQANVVDIDPQDNGTVKIEDNDFGSIAITTVDADADEGEQDSGKYQVDLKKDGTTTSGPATSSQDVLASVEITGDAIPGTDFRATINSTGTNTSIEDAQRIDGFWSLRDDANIGNSTTEAHNTINAVVDGDSIQYYKVVLYQPGIITADIDGTSGFNSHLRILSEGQLASQNAIAGNNNSGGDAGSSSTNDARVRTGTLAAGTYFIEVSDHRLANNNNLAVQANRTEDIASGETYTLHVSVSGMDEGVLIPAGQSMTMFNIDPIEDTIVEGGKDESFGSESVNFELTGFERRDPDIRIHEGGNIDEPVVITDNDSAFLSLEVTEATADEDPLFSGVPRDGEFTVTLQASSTDATPVTSSIDTTVKFTVSGDADLGDDYVLTASGGGTISQIGSSNMFTLNIPAGESQVTITVDVTNEDLIEDQETVTLTLVGDIDSTNGPGSSDDNMGDIDIDIDNDSATVTIDDEDPADVTIDGDAFAQEGGQVGVFTVSLDSPHVSDTDTDVEFTLMFPANTLPSTILADIDLSSILGGDVILFNDSPTVVDTVNGLAPLTGVVRIPALSPSAEIRISAFDDSEVEDIEFVKVKLQNIFNNQADSNIQVTSDPAKMADEIEVRDNDKAFVRITAVANGSEPGTDGQFQVELVAADGVTPVTTSVPVVVSYDVLTTPTSANGAALNDGINADYRELSGEVTILAGDSSATIDVEVFDDFLLAINEGDETVDLRVTETDALLTQVMVMDDVAETEATVIISDNDAIEVSIEAVDPYAREANDNGLFRVSLSGRSDGPVEVNLGVLLGNGPNADATFGDDYNLSNTVVSFIAGQTEQFVNLNVINDAELEEFIEQAEIEVGSIVSANSGVTLQGDAAIVKIHPDPTVQIQALDNQGMEGADDASFIVHLPFVENAGGPVFDGSSPLGFEIGTADGDLTVSYEVRGDSTNGDDFTFLTGTVTIPAADGYAIINVDITDDNIIEDLENVSIQIKSVTAADINDSDIDVRRDLYSVSPDDGLLRVINTAPDDGTSNDGDTISSVAITIDGVAVNGGYGLTVDPATHDLFAVVETDDIFRALVVIDPATGEAELIGALEDGDANIGEDDFRDIAFDAAGNLRGVTNEGTLYTVNKVTGAISGPISLPQNNAGQSDSLALNPLDGTLFHGDNESLETEAGTLVAGTGSGFDFNGLVHLEDGNFAGNAFFAADNDDSDLDLHTLDDSTPALDATSSLFGDLDHNVESLAFIKSNAFVTIRDNDTGFVEVKPKTDGADNLNDDADTGFNITLRGPDGTTATTSDTDTTVAFTIDNTATPFLGAQTAIGGGGFQNIDGFPGGSFGGSLFFSPDGAGTPHTIINGDDGATYTFTFTVLNNGDQVDIGFDLGSGTIEVFNGISTTAVDSLGIPSSIFSTGLAAGTYTIRAVVADASLVTVDPFSLNVAIENHLIADYQLTSAGNDLTPTDIDAGEWEVTIPAGEESVMVVVDVFNDTQIENNETVSLWLDQVVGGDIDIHLGFAYFTDNTDGGDGGNDRIGRVDIDGTDLRELLNTDAVVPGDSDPFGISIDRAENKIYFSEIDGGVQGIYRADLGFDGLVVAGTVELVVATAFSPRGIEVVGDQVYWVDDNTSELHRIDKDGSGPIEDVLDLPDSVSDLDDLSIDEVNGYVYWVDDGLDRVSRYRLDGTSSIETIVQFTAANPGSPQSIALDVEGGKVYWTNAANDTIQRSDLDGDNLQTIADTGTGFPNGIALDLKNDYVYWNDTSPGGGGVETIRRVFFGDLPNTGAVALQPTEVVDSVLPLDGIQNLNHLEVDVRTHLHATATIVDNDSAVVFVSTDNTLDEALDDTDSDPGQAREDGTGSAATDNKDIVISLRDANGNPVTSQTGTSVDYVYDAASTASNGFDHVLLNGDAFIKAGTSSVSLTSSPNSGASVFVIDDNVLEGDENVIVTLDGTSNPEITVVTTADPNYETDEDTGFVVILDDEVAVVSVDADDAIAKERDGIDEGLDPGVFHIDFSQASVTDTTVMFQVTTDAEIGDFSLSAPAVNNLTMVSPGVYSVVVEAGNFNPGAVITVNVADDSIVELNEFVTIEVLATSNSAITVGADSSDTVTIFDDDVAKVIVENNGNATESTQPGTLPGFTLASPGADGQFSVSLVDPFTGDLIESETDTTVRVLLDPASTAGFGADFFIPGFIDIDPGPGVQYAGLVTFDGNGGIAGSAGPGASTQFIDVQLLSESPGSSTNPLDSGDEIVKLTLDPTYGVVGDGRLDDGVVGDGQIELDVADGDAIFFEWEDDHPCPDFVVDGMGMNMAEVAIIDETFKINITANDENAAEPGTDPITNTPGDNGQFTITIDNPFQFGDTIVNYTLTGTATTASLAGGVLNPADFEDLDGYDPSNPDFIAVSIDGQIVIPAGQSSVLLDVDVIDDNLLEFLDPETVIVTLTGLDSELSSVVENVSMIADSTSVTTDFNRMLGTNLTATVSISDDDGADVTPSASSTGPAIEPDSPGVNGEFTLTLSNPSTIATTVRFTLSGDADLAPFGTAVSATDAGDYVLQLNSDSVADGASLVFVSGETYDATFAAGETEIKIDLITLDDFIIEDDETATLTIDGIEAGDPGITAGGSATITIEDTDVGELKLEVLDGVALEDGTTNDAAYVLRLYDVDDPTQRLASDTDTEVTFAVTGGTADLGADFDFGSLTTTVTIPAFTGLDPDFTLGNDAEVNIPVISLPDSIVELTETVEVTTTAVDGGANDASIDLHSMLAMRTGVVSILDNDSATVSIKSDVASGGDPDAAETDPEGQNDGRFVVLLSEESSTPTTVRYEVDLSATDPLAFYGVDFTLNGQAGPFIFGEVTIDAGDLSAPITLDVLDNLTQEDAENVTVRLIPVPGTNDVTGDQDITIDDTMDRATITIQDNDLPTFTVRNTMANEDAGTVTFTIDLSQPIDVDVEVFLQLSNGTATGAAFPFSTTNTPDEDFNMANTSTVNFPANGGVSGTDLSRTITVDINDDIFVELDEVFTAQLIVQGASLANTLPGGREINILDNQDADEEYGQALIKDNDTATFTIFKSGNPDADPTVDEGTDSPNPYNNNSPLTTVSFDIAVSNPIDVSVPLTVSFGGGTATGANFSVDGSPGSLMIDQNSPVPFGTDFDSGSQTVTFAPGDLLQTIHVGVVQDLIVEGGASSTLSSFGVETFVANIDASNSDLGDRSHVDSDDSTATIHDRDTDDPTMDDGSDTVRGDDNDQATITVAATDDEATEPSDIPAFDNGVWTITQSNPSSTTTVVRFQLSGTADFEGPDADYTLTAAVVGAPSVPVNLTNLGGGEYTVEIPGSPGGDEYTQVEITLNVTDDDDLTDGDDGDGLIEDDEQAILTLVEVVSGDPEVRLDSEMQSDTIQIDDDDEGLVSVKSDVANDGDPDAAETDPEGGDDGRFVFFLRDSVGDLTVSDTATLVEFQVTLPTATTAGSNVNTNPTNGQANPLNDFDFNSSTIGNALTFNPTTGLGTITIPAGESSVVLDVEVTNDTLQELAELITVTALDTISDAAIDIDNSMDEAIVTIAASDGLKVVITSAGQGSEPNQEGQFTVQILDRDGEEFEVPVGSTTNGDGLLITYTVLVPPTDPDTGEVLPGFADQFDFVELSGEVRIREGESMATISVDIEDDDLIEGTEVLRIQLDGIFNFEGQSSVTELNGEAICHDEAVASLDIIDDDTSLAVTGVKVGSSAWSSAFNDIVDPGTTDGFQGYAIGTGDDQNNTVPWVNINQLIVTFSEGVDLGSLSAANFILHGVQDVLASGSDTPDIVGFDFDPLTNSVRLELDGNIVNDRLRLEIRDDVVSSVSGSQLNGEFTNDDSSFESGDNSTGGDFNFDFNVLPGDASGSTDPNTAVTNAADAGATFTVASGSFFGVPTTTSTAYLDVNGDGSVQASDAGAIFTLASTSFFGLQLPSLPASITSFSSGLAGLNGDSGVTPDLSQSSTDSSDDDSGKRTARSISSTKSGASALAGSIDGGQSEFSRDKDAYFSVEVENSESKKDRQSLTDDIFGKSTVDLLKF